MLWLQNTALNLTCRDENHLARRTVTKYVWLKNGQPIQSSCEEIIEDLTPIGSLLKIVSIQVSAEVTVNIIIVWKPRWANLCVQPICLS